MTGVATEGVMVWSDVSTMCKRLLRREKGVECQMQRLRDMKV